MSQILNSGSISSRLLILTLSLFQCLCYREHIILTTFSYSATEKSTSCRPPCMAFLPPPFRRRFPALPCGVIAVYPMQTVMRLKAKMFSPTGAFIAPLRKRELLRTRHFRRCARKNEGNFGEKREDWMVPALLTKHLTMGRKMPRLIAASGAFVGYSNEPDLFSDSGSETRSI